MTRIDCEVRCENNMRGRVADELHMVRITKAGRKKKVFLLST